MEWRELWRLTLSPGTGAPSPVEPPPAPDEAFPTTPEAGPDPDAGVTERPRFLFVVARTRLDLYLTIRRRFLDDRAVYVLLDRREQGRRSKPSPVYVPERRRQPDRRRPRDYWEDTAHHPAVLIPLSPRQRDATDNAPSPSAETPARDKEPTMERVLVDEARMLAWVQEGQHVLQHVLPAVLDERDTLRNQLDEATRRCKDLQQENDGLRAEVARASAVHQQLEQNQAGIADSVEQFLAQMRNVLEPMRSLAERVRQTSPRRDGADHAG
jgi:hypothetical protein